GALTQQVESKQAHPFNPELSGSLRRLVDRLLRKDPDERYQTADDLLADLISLRERITAPPLPGVPSPHERRPLTTRSRALLGAIAALAVVGTVLGVLRWGGSSNGGDSPVSPGSRGTP